MGQIYQRNQGFSEQMASVVRRKTPGQYNDVAIVEADDSSGAIDLHTLKRKIRANITRVLSAYQRNLAQ